MNRQKREIEPLFGIMDQSLPTPDREPAEKMQALMLLAPALLVSDAKN
jgi:hypothetical protein